jgi:hypothetical protein
MRLWKSAFIFKGIDGVSSLFMIKLSLALLGGDAMMCQMLQTFKLLLPALVPSWRFFDGIAPSPRVEYALSADGAWQEFRPRPVSVSPFQVMGRLFYNARWNESLFLVSCAERLIEEPSAHSRAEILERIRADLDREGVDHEALRFRLVFVSRADGGGLQKQVLFVSDVDESAGQ